MSLWLETFLLRITTTFKQIAGFIERSGFSTILQIQTEILLDYRDFDILDQSLNEEYRCLIPKCVKFAVREGLYVDC